MSITEKRGHLTFGLFEIDLETGELWKAGFRIKLAGQPFRVLVALLERPGEVVTREELHTQIWGATTNVDIERSVAGTINKIREALGDSAENPRFIETLTKRGYRFIAPVARLHGQPESAPGAPAVSVIAQQPVSSHAQEPVQLEVASPSAAPAISPTSTPGRPMRAPLELLAEPPRSSAFRTLVWIPVAVVAAVAVVLVLFPGHWSLRAPEAGAPVRIEKLTHYIPISAGPPNFESFLTMATDGERILTSVIVDGRPRLSSIDITTGDAHQLATPQGLSSNSLADISPDNSKLLLRANLSTESEQSLWIVPSAGGSGLRVGNVLAHDATWMPDGNGILFANGNDLATVNSDGSSPTPLVKLQGRAFWLRWSPDGKLLRFTLVNPVLHTSSLWELARGDTKPRPVLKESLSACCGTWTADGSRYIFESGQNLWELKGSGRSSSLRQLTNGPLRFFSPVAARSGSRIYFVGLESPAALEQYDSNQHEFRAAPAFLADANRVEYSRDGLWVAWTDSNEKLWRAKAADGSDKVQLTSDSLEVFLAHWSPDGHRLAIMAREHGSLWQTYLLDADGGKPEAPIVETRNAADPGWSADGRKMVFGREPDRMGKESDPRTIQILDLATHETHQIPNSEGLFSPRWSPDGRWITALTLDQKRVMLYSVAENRWKLLAETSAADPVWSADSRFLYVHAFLAEGEPILKIDVSSGALQTVANLSNFRDRDAANYFFGGLTPANEPLVQPRIGTGNIYTLDAGSR